MPPKLTKKAPGSKAGKIGLSFPAGITKPMSKAAKAKQLQKIVEYAFAKDRTLTASQAKNGFRPMIVKAIVKRQAPKKGGFRFPSNPTQAGFSSGYHESFVVTDMTDKLAGRKVASNGMAQMPAMSGISWGHHSGASFPESNLSSFLHAGDNSRTDTARTILSGPGGAVAGHTGSGVYTGGQSEAHDVLRDHSMHVLADPHMTPHAVGVIAAATTITGMAPGLLASTAHNAHQLKDQAARGTWEDDRNAAKETLAVAFNALTPTEKKVVRGHQTKLFIAIGGGRTMDADYPTSPRRTSSHTSSDIISGGGYDKHSKLGSGASVGFSAHADEGTIAAGVSAFFRTKR